MRRNLRLLQAFQFFASFRLLAGIWVIYFFQITGSYAATTTVLSVYTVAVAVFEVPTGVLSDKIGRTRTMSLGVLASMVGLTSYALADSFAWLLVGSILLGLCDACYSGNNDALLYETLAEKKQARRYNHWYGRVYAPSQLALAVAATIGGILAFQSFALALWISVGIQAICLVISQLLREPKRVRRLEVKPLQHAAGALRLVWRNKKLRALSLAQAWQEGIGEVSFNFRAAFIVLVWPLWAVGFAKALAFAAAYPSFHFAGRLIDRFSALSLLVVGRVYNTVAFLVAVLKPTLASPVLMASTSLFYGVNRAGMSSLMQREFTKDQRATMASLAVFGGSLVFALVATGLGALADWIGPGLALAVINLALLPLVLVYRYVARLPKAA